MRVPSRLKKKIDWLFRRAEGVFLPEADLAAGGAAAHLDPNGARLALLAATDDLEIVGAADRFQALRLASTDSAVRENYIAEHGVCGTRRFHAGSATIYQLTVETFPRHVNNVYLVLENGSSLLFDCGSGLPSSERDMTLGFAVLARMFLGEGERGEHPPITREDVDTCLISHAHADHFGGVNQLRKTSRASLAVHELDARVISSFEERLILASKDMDVFWRRSGVPAGQRTEMGELYQFGKRLFHSESVDRTLRDGDLIGQGSYKVHHVPGHCPGLVCLQVHDVLLTSDHVLSRITPHQFPAITAFAGLEHYFQSLEKIRRVEGIRLALGGHEEPMHDLRARVDEIAAFHRMRLDQTLAICSESPRTIHEIAREMFGEQEGYGVVLAIDEAGAHVEYLHALGRVRVDNLEEVSASDDPIIRYVARSSSSSSSSSSSPGA